MNERAVVLKVERLHDGKPMVKYNNIYYVINHRLPENIAELVGKYIIITYRKNEKDILLLPIFRGIHEKFNELFAV